MATAAGSPSQEYWRPSNPDVARVVTTIRGTCRRCGTDFSAGARYCYACGGARDPRWEKPFLGPEAVADEKTATTNSGKWRLSIPATVFFILGIACALAAAFTGLIYRADTLVDWQAVQTWRIEWLLAAIAALLAGALVK